MSEEEIKQLQHFLEQDFQINNEILELIERMRIFALKQWDFLQPLVQIKDQYRLAFNASCSPIISHQFDSTYIILTVIINNILSNSIINNPLISPQGPKIDKIFESCLSNNFSYPKLLSAPIPHHFFPNFERQISSTYSSFILQLSSVLNLYPNDIASLSLIPENFPLTKSAFSELFFKLIDEQEHLEQVELDYVYQSDITTLLTCNPSFQTVSQSNYFEKFLLTHQQYMDNILSERDNLNKLDDGLIFQQIDKICQDASEIAVTHLNLYAKYLCKNDNLILIQNLIAKTIELSKQAEKIDINLLLHDFNSWRKHLTDIISNLRFILLLLEKPIKQDEFIPTLSCLFEFKDFLISSKQEIKELASKRKDIDQKFMKDFQNHDMKLLNPENLTVQSLKGMINFLNKKIEEKSKLISQYDQKLYESRIQTERITYSIQQIKEKKMRKNTLCKTCELSRAFAIKNCGHSFCKSCFMAILDGRICRCPYCQQPFEKGDFIEIKW